MKSIDIPADILRGMGLPDTAIQRISGETDNTSDIVFEFEGKFYQTTCENDEIPWRWETTVPCVEVHKVVFEIYVPTDDEATE